MDLRLVAPPLALPKSPPIIPLHSAMASGIPSLAGPHQIHYRHKNGGPVSAPQQQRPIHQVRPLFSGKFTFFIFLKFILSFIDIFSSSAAVVGHKLPNASTGYGATQQACAALPLGYWLGTTGC